MDSKEFENKLEQIKTFKEVPISVDEKIQKAFEKIEQNEKLEKEVKKQKSKFNFSRVLSLAASFVMAIFLAGNGVAYAKGEPNIYSWVLEKIGIQKEYEQIKTEINQTVKEDGVEITLLDIGFTDNVFIIGVNIKSDENIFENMINNRIFINLSIKIPSIDKQIEVFGGEEILVNKIEDNEYIVYNVIDVTEENINYEIDNATVEIKEVAVSLGGTPLDDEYYQTVATGKWNFECKNLNIQYGSKYLKEYKQTIGVLDIEEIKLYKTKVIDFININCELNNEKYENIYEWHELSGNIIYTIEDSVTGEKSDFLRLNSILPFKLEENKIYNINFYEYNRANEYPKLGEIQFTYNSNDIIEK